MSSEHSSAAIRVGVIGLGYGGETHLKNYRQLPDVQVVALAGLEEDRLQYLGATYHYEELLSRDDLDAISICVPNYLHLPIALAAFDRGFHVLSEKPLARTGAEAEQIAQAAIQANRVLEVVFNHRMRNDIRVLKRVIDDGGLGHIYYVKVYWMRRHGIPGSGTWFVNREMSGGGPLIDLGVHVLDMGLHLLGEPEAITVTAATYNEIGKSGRGVDKKSRKFSVGNAFEVEDLATAFIRLSSGATLTLETSWATHSDVGDDFGVSIYGTKGGAEIRVKNYSWEDTLRIFTDVADAPAETRPRLTRGEGHLAVIRGFIEAIRGGNWSAHTGSEGVEKGVPGGRSRSSSACLEQHPKLGKKRNVTPIPRVTSYGAIFADGAKIVIIGCRKS
jgi:predicted dehydrogenase